MASRHVLIPDPKALQSKPHTAFFLNTNCVPANYPAKAEEVAA